MPQVLFLYLLNRLLLLLIHQFLLLDFFLLIFQYPTLLYSEIKNRLDCRHLFWRDLLRKKYYYKSNKNIFFIRLFAVSVVCKRFSVYCSCAWPKIQISYSLRRLYYVAVFGYYCWTAIFAESSRTYNALLNCNHNRSLVPIKRIIHYFKIIIFTGKYVRPVNNYI